MRTSRLSLVLRIDGAHGTEYRVPMLLELRGHKSSQTRPTHHVHTVVYFGDVVFRQLVQTYTALERGLNETGELCLLFTELPIFSVKFALDLERSCMLLTESTIFGIKLTLELWNET